MQNNSTKMITIAVAVFIVIAGATAIIAINNGNDDGEDQYDVIDAAGNKIKLDETPKRIVSLDAVSTELICELGLTENLVGVTSDDGVHDLTNFIYGYDYDIGYPDKLKSQIASGYTVLVGPNRSWTTDKVMTVNPDLVIFQNTADNLAKMKVLQEYGVTCLVTNNSYDSLEVIYENTELVGKALGKSERAELLNDSMKAVVAYIYEKCNGFAQKDVIMIASTGGNLYAYGESNLKHVVLRAMGCTTSMAGSATGIVTVENILTFQPDIIIFDPMGTTTNISDLKAYHDSDPLWADVKAVQNHTAYYLEYSAYQATGYTSHHFVHGIALMATIVFDEIGIDVPQIVTEDKYLDYITWIDRRE